MSSSGNTQRRLTEAFAAWQFKTGAEKPAQEKQPAGHFSRPLYLAPPITPVTNLETAYSVVDIGHSNSPRPTRNRLGSNFRFTPRRGDDHQQRPSPAPLRSKPVAAPAVQPPVNRSASSFEVARPSISLPRPSVSLRSSAERVPQHQDGPLTPAPAVQPVPSLQITPAHQQKKRPVSVVRAVQAAHVIEEEGPLHRPPLSTHSSSSTTRSYTSTSTTTAHQPPLHNQRADIPHPPPPDADLEHRIAILTARLTSTGQTLLSTTASLSNRRPTESSLFDPVLIPLHLAADELANAHSCVKQALLWHYLTPEGKEHSEEQFFDACAELDFAVRHLDVQERNASLSLPLHSQNQDHGGSLKEVALNGDVSDGELRFRVGETFPLSEELKSAIAGVERALRMLTRIRISHRLLLYRAMAEAMDRDERMGKGGLGMDVLLHPAWN